MQQLACLHLEAPINLSQSSDGSAYHPTVDALGNRTTTTFDAAGNVASVQDARGNPTTYSYDAANRRVAVTEAGRHRRATDHDHGLRQGRQHHCQHRCAQPHHDLHL
jgi:YD repeat-containing protein